jgi:DNA modification methylase
VTILNGDVRDVLPTLPAASVQCVVTSPPYFGLRNYGVDGQIGLEPSPDAYVAEMVAVFRAVRRVLRDDGVLFLNLGDSYAASRQQIGRNDEDADNIARRSAAFGTGVEKASSGGNARTWGMKLNGAKPKDLLMIPARVALALQADGWWLRSDIIWHKPNPMPESVTDRPTSAHEHVFLLAKSARYFWDADAVAEPVTLSSVSRLSQDIEHQEGSWRANGGAKTNGSMRAVGGSTRNCRSVWTIATQPFSEAHFAVFPAELAERCIRAGSRPGDTILDPFAGAFTAPMAADRLQRNAIGIELNTDYCDMARRRLVNDGGLFMELVS